MKKVVVILMLVLCIARSAALQAFCCMGDACSYSFARYVDDKGVPTGKYALLDDDNKPLRIIEGVTCTCVAGIGKVFPAKTCPHCVEALCPRPDCGHHIFQHTCALNIRSSPGTGIIEIRE